ncbi:transcription antiterminator [Aerococcus agrisoli]|uniref:Transcription antiterminator n=1 Tax=Aerococcus agrisoli TaxID=2487350 RepID=A0A3N4H230_9LACT|nr:BglG family transcription antiterminator [Aerococcus agrisoli]RPA65421.1 transcription antiterminator [Aerococcus agrisoli]
MIDQFDIKHKKLIQFILKKQKTNYEELSEYSGLSKRTVAKYLNEVRDFLNSFNVLLTIKQGEGVYLEGDLKELEDTLNSLNFYSSDSKENRQIRLYSKFILSSEFIKVQDLADEFFVSRSTIESELKVVRKKFLNQGFEIISNRNGMILDVSEQEKRELMSDLISQFWGGLSYSKDLGQNLILQVETSTYLEQILNTDNLKIITKILNTFTNITSLILTDYEYQSLAIHLTIAIERIRNNLFLEELNSETDKRIIENNTILLSELVEEEFDLLLPEMEKSYLNNHVIAIQNNVLNNEFSYTPINVKDKNLHNLITESLASINPDVELVKSLILHLDAAIVRLKLDLNIYNPYTEEIKVSFPLAFETAIPLVYNIEKNYQIKMNDDEIAYIAIHIQNFFERASSINRLKLKAVIVCSSGYGTSKLLEQRIKSMFFDEIEVSRVLSLGDLEKTLVTEDLIISTIPVSQHDIPVVQVSPLLGKLDREKILDVINKNTEENHTIDQFMGYLDEDLIFIDNGSQDREYVLSKLCGRLISKKYAKEGIFESSMAREEISSTAIDSFSMPHAQIEYIHVPKIAIYVNKDGIAWDKDNVKIVFFFALNKEAKKNINEVYSFFNELISNEEIMKKLIHVSDKDEIISLIKKVNE